MTSEQKARDIWEVANQLEGYVGPDTEERLANFLIREGKEAAKLAERIIELENTRAVPDVPELVRYTAARDLKGRPAFDLITSKTGDYVRYDQAAAMIAAKDAGFNKLEAAWLNAEGKITEFEAELATLKEINANLMGDDEDKPRYTTKRLKLEIEKAVAAEPAQGEQWHPIETAPKDGTWILAFYHKDCVPAVIFYDDEWRRWAGCADIGSNHFTHWMPLPAAPVDSDADLRAENERLREALSNLADIFEGKMGDWENADWHEEYVEARALSGKKPK